MADHVKLCTPPSSVTAEERHKIELTFTFFNQDNAQTDISRVKNIEQLERAIEKGAFRFAFDRAFPIEVLTQANLSEALWLDLRKCKKVSDAALAKLITCCSDKITHIDLSGTQASNQVCEELARLTERSLSIASISLRKCADIANINSILDAACTSRSLAVIDLRSTGINFDAITIEKILKVKHLTIKGDSLPEAIKLHNNAVRKSAKVFLSACRSGDQDIVRASLNTPLISMYAQDKRTKYTAMHEATAGGHVDVIRMLFNAGMRDCLLNKDNKSAFILASDLNHPEELILIKSEGKVSDDELKTQTTALLERKRKIDEEVISAVLEEASSTETGTSTPSDGSADG